MTGCRTQSHNPDIKLASPCPTLVMPTTRLDSDKYNFGALIVYCGVYANTYTALKYVLVSTKLNYGLGFYRGKLEVDIHTRGQRDLSRKVE